VTRKHDNRIRPQQRGKYIKMHIQSSQPSKKESNWDLPNKEAAGPAKHEART